MGLASTVPEGFPPRPTLGLRDEASRSWVQNAGS